MSAYALINQLGLRMIVSVKDAYIPDGRGYTAIALCNGFLCPLWTMVERMFSTISRYKRTSYTI